MLLRPATPLTILFLIAFVLLLLATISTPVITAIPLASFDGIDFGVFGYCQGTTCTTKVGYSTTDLYASSGDNSDFSLSSSARHSLSGILIVHPVAALLTLICFFLAFAAHFNSPAHSPRYLLALLILTFPTLLVALLAFLVDILLFVPHMQWGGWIVLAATILIIASGVVTCAMRRTLVSRKARKRRIAENAEMNGQNYYANNQPARMIDDELPRAESPPPMSGAIDDENKLPQFATFETTVSERKSSADDHDLTPLNPRSQSIRSAGSGRGNERTGSSMDEAPPLPGQIRDQYGNPITHGEITVAPGLPPPGIRHQPSGGSLASTGSNRMQALEGQPPPGYRGRGGFVGAPRGRGGYGPPRGGYGRGQRGGYGPPRGGMLYRGRGGPQGMRGPPPPGWQGPPPPMGRGAAGPGFIMPVAGTPVMARGQQAPPPGYGASYRNENDMPPPGLPPFNRSNGPPTPPQEDAMIGQAIEMDERTGAVSMPDPAQFGQNGPDGDAVDVVAMQQPRRDLTPTNQRDITPTNQRDIAMSQQRITSYGTEPPTPSSIYSQQTYVPVRPSWAAAAHVPALDVGPVSPIETAAPLPNNHSHSPALASPPLHRRTGSDHYYEDVDPQFASDPEVPTITYNSGSPRRQSALPNSLMPGSQAHLTTGEALNPGQGTLERDNSYENITEGARSPAGSDVSHFTSVSQRGVNPNWRPAPPPGAMGPGSAYGNGVPAQRKNEHNDMILGANPDFSIPGVGAPRGGGFRGRGRPRGATATSGRPAPGLGGLTPQGRYPTDI